MTMYKSPIELITEQMNTQIEDHIFKAIQKVAVNIDKEELIRVLQYDREQYEQGYRDGKQANQWISADQPPEKYARVLCYYNYEPGSPDVISENTYLGDGR